jgi:hypothetical protein
MSLQNNLLKFQESIKNTFLEEIINIPEKSFLRPNDVLTKGEKVVGEFTFFEKQCFTFCKQNQNLISDKNHTLSAEDNRYLPFISDIVFDFMVCIIRDRLTLKNFGDDGELHFRKGWEITLVHKNKPG